MTDTALTPDEQARFDTLYGTTPTAAEPDSPGVFAGAYKGLAGIPSGLAGATLSVASAATSTGGGYQSPILGAAYGADMNLSSDQLADLEKSSKDYFISSTQGRVHQSIENLRQSAADLYRPDPQTTGFVGNTLFGAADVLTRVAVGNVIAPGAGLGIAAGTTGFERTADLEAQGVDPATAMKSGVLTGGSLVAMGGVSSFGSSTLARVLSGAGSNVAFGAATRGLDSALLEANGYHAQAEQQKWSDGAAILADGIIGGAFHLLPRARAEAPIPADHVDAALTAKSSQNVSDLAPGVPADPRSASAHVNALDTAQAQLMDGQPVAVDPVVRDANFVPRPEQAAPELHDALADAGVPRESLAEPVTTPDQALKQRLSGDPAKLFAEYAALPDSKGGRVLNTDVARELSPEYLADRTRSADVHEGASAAVKAMYEAKLAEPTPDGFNRSVLFTAGGTGAGKSTAVDAMSGAENPPELVYDTNMNSLASADRKVQQALDAGRKVQILYVYRDPVEALTHGALSRAERQRKEFGSGRTVPLSEHAKTHTGVRPVMEALAEKYKNDPRVIIQGFDNSRGKDNGAFADLANIPQVDQNGLHERLKTALLQEHQAGRISDATRAGFERAGRDPQGIQRPPVQAHSGELQASRPQGRSPAGLNPGSRGAPDAQTSKGSVGAAGRDGSAQRGDTAGNDATNQRNGLDPARDGEVALAREIVAEHPAEVLGDGTTIADAMRSADEKYAEAVKQGDGIQAAIACFLRFGAGA
jgi:hypothetical protein